ncbi:MAG: (2Fe-2S)-binding protein [Bacilli bacterium]|nr:(2Fe-2S)-binding protein [Bacilli bacterium]
MKIKFNLNKKDVIVDVDPSMRLLDVLRNVLHLTGTKEGCGEGSCGACSVLVDNMPYDSCLTPVINVMNKQVMTIEGIRESKEYETIANSFAKMGGSQCGFCTPGMIIVTYALLMKNPNPSEEEIRLALSGNICRCTGYQAIVNAVKDASKGGKHE